MSADRTLRGLIAAGRDDAVAIAAHEAPPLSYGALRALIDRAVRSLNDLGVGRGDRVAIVLPNGPEMATAFLAWHPPTPGAAQSRLSQDEFEFYLEDLKAKALVVEEGSTSPALRAAGKLGVALITLAPEPQAGLRLSGASVDAVHTPSKDGRLPTPLSCETSLGSAGFAGRTGRGRSHPAHLRHHLAAEIVPLRMPTFGSRRATLPPRSRLPTTIAASTSCRCSIFTA